tara:strand:- start:10575 stop:11354 length:780 start_codon:yes stop_codon:yes gene_type:complete
MKKYDKYYTNKKIINICCKIFKKYIKIHKNDLIIEPSAGNGAFIPCIKKYNILLLDIHPENKKIIKKNFLTYNYNKIKKKYTNIHAIGNPPFGKKSSLAIKFIKKCSEFCDSFSFILPKSFNKYFLQKSIPLNFHLIKSYNLPDDSFGFPEIRCVFQIWEKRRYDRKKNIKKIFPNKNYKFVSKLDNPDIAIRRVGSKSGYIYYDDLKNKNKNTHYFIKILKRYNKVKKLNLNTEKNNTLAAYSISKMDIIKKLNIIII